MHKTLKISICILLILVLIGVVAILIYNGIHRYDPENYIGITAEQIIDRYGAFDRYKYWDGTDTYRYGLYVVKPKQVGYLGTYNEEHFIIRFDENGVAYECEYVVTGAGG